MPTYLEVKCFFCHKPMRIKREGQLDTQVHQSTQFYHKKCFKKIMEVYAKQGRVVQEEPTFEIVTKDDSNIDSKESL